MATPEARARRATDEASFSIRPGGGDLTGCFEHSRSRSRCHSGNWVRSVNSRVSLVWPQRPEPSRSWRNVALSVIAGPRPPYPSPPRWGRWPAGPDGGRTTPTLVIPDCLFSDNPGCSRVLESLPKFNRDLVLFSKWVRFAKMEMSASGSIWLLGHTSYSLRNKASFRAAVPTWNGVGFVRRTCRTAMRRWVRSAHLPDRDAALGSFGAVAGAMWRWVRSAHSCSSISPMRVGRQNRPGHRAWELEWLLSSAARPRCFASIGFAACRTIPYLIPSASRTGKLHKSFGICRADQLHHVMVSSTRR